RAVFSGGEVLRATTAARVREVLGAEVHNLYGPTETTVQVAHRTARRDDAEQVPLGRPVWNTRFLVLDAALRPVPVGVPGELYVVGSQVARGYQAGPAVTADRFVANAFGNSGDRMYRTGDRVRWNRDGELEYLGRTDFQVKLNGQRVELGEIESALLAHPGITQAVV